MAWCGSIYDRLIHPSLPGFNADLTAYPYDPAQATALLNEAGWRDDDGDGILESYGVEGLEDGCSFNVELGAPANPPLYGNVAQVLQQNLRDVGIETSINLVDFGVYFSEYLSAESDYVFGVSGWFNLLFPPESELEVGYSTDVPNTQYIHYSNPEIDEMLGEERGTFDAEARNPIYHRIQEIIQQDAPVTYLFRPEVGALTTLMDTVAEWYWQE